MIIFRRIIKPHFPNEQDVKAAVESLTYLIDEKTGSGMPTEWTNNMAQLNHSQCRFVCKSFRSFRVLSDEDKRLFTPITLSSMSAAVRGAHEIVEYLKDVGMELKIPPALQPFDREVWLRDCTTRLPLKSG